MELSRSRERLLRRIASRRGREAEGVVLLEGPRVLEAALAHGVVPSFLVRGGRESSHDLDVLTENLARAGAEVVEVPATAFAELAQTDSPQGILGIAAEPRATLPDPKSAGAERCLLLDGVQDPGNVGTLIRTAAALGITRVLALDGTADPWSAKAVRASAGLCFALPVLAFPWEEADAWRESAGLPLLVAERGGEDIRSWLASRAGPRISGLSASGSMGRGEGGLGWALLLGNEGQGPRAAARARAAAQIAIPLAASVDSLNVSIAGAILLWALGPGRESAPSSGGKGA